MNLWPGTKCRYCKLKVTSTTNQTAPIPSPWHFSIINQSRNGMCEILDRTQEMNHGSTALSKSIKKLLEFNKNVLLVVYIQRIRELTTKELL